MGTTQNALSNNTELRLFHNPETDFPGPGIAASLGVDNIQATAPEPGAIGLISGGLLLLAMRRKKR